MLVKQQLLQGQPYTDVQFKYPKWLKFDGVNDYVLFNDSSFYNLGGKDFTLCVKAFICRLGAGGSSRLLSLVQKGTTTGAFYWLGTLGGSFREIGFRFGETTNSRGFGVPTTNFSIENSQGMFTPINLAFIRTNQDGSIAKLVDRANYKVWINGIRYDCSQIFSSGTLTTDPFNNSNNVTMNGTTGTSDISRMYLSSYNFYTKALSDAEIEDVFDNNISYLNNKGSYNFNSEYGAVVRDNSSVANNGTLINYATTSDEATNSVWIDEIIGFITNTTKTYVASKDLTVTKIGRGFHQSPTATSFTVVHKRGATILNTYTYNWGGSIASNLIDSTYQIPMQKNDVLEITTSGMTGGVNNSGGGYTYYGCVCEIFTH